MVEHSENDAERSLTQLFNDFISVGKMLIVSDYVLLLIRVESIVCFFVQFAIGSSTRNLRVSLILYAFLDIKKINRWELHDLLLFVIV